MVYRAFRGAAEQSDPSANPVLRLVRRTVPITNDVRGRRLFVREGGRRYGTPLLLAREPGAGPAPGSRSASAMPDCDAYAEAPAATEIVALTAVWMSSATAAGFET